MNKKPHAPLSGVRIIDFTRVMSGPLCTALLADLGAEVIKIESPDGGDISRQVGPFVGSTSTYFASLNRNKKSIVLDLKIDEGKQIASDLMAKADVVVENFRPGVMKRLGLGWDTGSSRNEKLIYASISGFGQSGSLANLPAYDLVVQAISGLMHTTGEEDGSPLAVGESIADASAGLLAAWAIMVALFDRERNGRGRYLDISMTDSLLAMMATNVSVDLNGAESLERRGNKHPSTSPVDSYVAADGEFVMVCFGDAAFQKLAAVINRPELVNDSRFSSNDARLANDRQLKKIINEWASSQLVEQVVNALQNAGLPCAPIMSLHGLDQAGYLDERGLKQSFPVGQDGHIQIISKPVRFNDDPQAPPVSVPSLGADTSDVLKTVLTYHPSQIEAMEAKGCFGSKPLDSQA